MLSNRAARYRPSAETDPDHDATHIGGTARSQRCARSRERTPAHPASTDGGANSKGAGLSSVLGQAAKVAAATEDPVDVTSLAPRRWPTSTDPMFLESCPVPPLTVNVPKATVDPSSTCSMHLIGPL